MSLARWTTALAWGLLLALAPAAQEPDSRP